MRATAGAWSSSFSWQSLPHYCEGCAAFRPIQFIHRWDGPSPLRSFGRKCRCRNRKTSPSREPSNRIHRLLNLRKPQLTQFNITHRHRLPAIKVCQLTELYDSTASVTWNHRFHGIERLWIPPGKSATAICRWTLMRRRNIDGILKRVTRGRFFGMPRSGGFRRQFRLIIVKGMCLSTYGTRRRLGGNLPTNSSRRI